MRNGIHARRRKADPRVNLSSNELMIGAPLRPDLPIAGVLTADLLTRYSPVADHAEHLADYLGLHPDELVLTPGSDVALRLICADYRARTGGRGTLLLQEPNYIAWQQQAAAGAGLHTIPVTADLASPREQGLHLVQLAAAHRGAMIAISVPNGLSGGSIPETFVDQLIELACERDHELVIDACYQAFSGFIGEQLAKRGPNVLVVQSLSKSHGLAGARVAVVAGPPDRLAALDAGPLEQAVSGPALLAMRLAIDAHDRFTDVWRDVGKRRDEYASRIADWGLLPLPSRANFLAVRIGTADDAALVTRRLSDSGFRVRDMSGLPGLTGCVRFTIADADTMERFLTAFRHATGLEAERC